MAGALPHRIAVLCYLYDQQGRLLLLHRRKNPNSGMFSPIGGKLETSTGEGPHDCAVREIREETGVEIDHDDLRMMGLVSERAYQGEGHWLIFLFEVTRPIRHDEMKWTQFEEGQLEWKHPSEVSALDIPRTDRDVMWPLVQEHRGRGFFAVHIDWAQDGIAWKVHESIADG
jgi:8-oxo-dGTP diphosphatase